MDPSLAFVLIGGLIAGLLIWATLARPWFQQYRAQYGERPTTLFRRLDDPVLERGRINILWAYAILVIVAFAIGFFSTWGR